MTSQPGQRYLKVVFDCDGVLINSRAVVGDLLKELGYQNIPKLLREMFQDPSRFFKKSDLDATKFFGMLDSRYGQAAAFDNEDTDIIGLVKEFAACNPETPKYVLSSNSEPTIAKRLGELLEIDSVFVSVFGHEKKPRIFDEGLSVKAQILSEIAGNCSPADCLFVGDTHSDLVAGHQAGWATIGVTWGGFHDRADLKPFFSDSKHIVALVDTASQLKQWLMPSSDSW